MGRTPHYRRTPPTLKRAQAEAPDQATQLVRGFFARATSQRVLHYTHKNNPPETTQGSNTMTRSSTEVWNEIKNSPLNTGITTGEVRLNYWD